MPAPSARDTRNLQRNNDLAEKSKEFTALGHRLLRDADAK